MVPSPDRGSPTRGIFLQNRRLRNLRSLLSRLLATTISTKTSIQCSLRASNLRMLKVTVVLYTIFLLSLVLYSQFYLHQKGLLQRAETKHLYKNHMLSSQRDKKVTLFGMTTASDASLNRQRLTNAAAIAESQIRGTKRTNRNVLQLRYDWTKLERHSALAQRIAEMQSDCSNRHIGNFWYRNRFGLGSDLHVYSVALCNAMQMKDVRVGTLLPWTWYDEESCKGASAMTCYFPEAEPECIDDEKENDFDFMSNRYDSTTKRRVTLNLTRPAGKIKESCGDIHEAYGGVAAVRAAVTEFLFTRVSPLVYHEAQRQLQRVFHSSQRVPENLITVHIRWGDKSDEMELIPVSQYISAVQQIVDRRSRNITPSSSSNDVHVFLSTEDPDACTQFLRAAPRHWNVYVDEYFYELLPHRPLTTMNRSLYNSIPQMAQALHGRPGILALGSLLVAMEAKDFVLTTASNWSRLMNEIRLNIINPRCKNCTTMIDLKYGEW